MKTHFVKHRVLALLYSFTISSALFSCSLLPDGDWDHGKNPGSKKTISALHAVLEKFALTEKNKDAEGHRDLFASETSGLNFVLKNYGNPMVATLPRDQWIGFFTSWDYAYHAVYSDIKFYLENGMAIDRHFFQGFKNDVRDISGIDLFMYINTEKGWKILNVSSTILNPDDSTNYDSLNIISSKPKDAIVAVQTGINKRQMDTFTNAFLSTSTPCFRFKNVLKQYDSNLHSAAAFYNMIPATATDFTMSFDRVQITVEDKLVAFASSDYSVKKGNKAVERGKMLSTLVAVPQQGWKISSMAFSVSK